MNDKGMVSSVQAGQRFMDAQVEAVGPDFVTLKPESGPLQTVKLFASGDPPARTYDAKKFNGSPVSFNLDGGISTLAAMTAEISGMNVVLQAGLNSRVQIAARNAPWDALFAGALADAGLDYRTHDAILLVGRPEPLDKLARAVPPGAGMPVTLAFNRSDMRDLGPLFAHISGLSVTLPASSCESVTVFLNEVPWDEALGWITASCGWRYRIENNAILIEAPGR
jgi:hypothetical protein